MTFELRFVGKVDPRLKREILPFTRWLRRWYPFPVTFELRLVHQNVLTDTDGARCHLRWWQNDSGRPVIVEIAVGLFATNLRKEGEGVAYPTVIAAIGRAMKYYYMAIRDQPPREDYAEKWGDRLLDSYINSLNPPPPWRGAKKWWP